MFFNKAPQPTSADLERRRLLHKLYVANQHLAERAELVIVRRGVVDPTRTARTRNWRKLTLIKQRNPCSAPLAPRAGYGRS